MRCNLPKITSFWNFLRYFDRVWIFELFDDLHICYINCWRESAKSQAPKTAFSDKFTSGLPCFWIILNIYIYVIYIQHICSIIQMFWIHIYYIYANLIIKFFTCMFHISKPIWANSTPYLKISLNARIRVVERSVSQPY